MSEVKRTTADDVANAVVGMQADIDKSLAEGEGCPEFLLPLFKAGHWLSVRMEADGADEEASQSACFALGQRAMMRGGAQNAYALAAEAYDRWREGRPDRGGPELGDALVNAAKADGAKPS